MPYELILIENKNHIAKIIFNNGKYNWLNIAMMKEINHAIEMFSRDKTLKALVFDHTERNFSVGVDVEEHMGDKAKRMLKEFHGIFKRLLKLSVPTVASVKGAALGGGCEIALFCDFVIASEDAKFGQPEIKVGVFPPLAAALLPYLIPIKKAYEIIMHGESFSAEEAYQLGLVNHVFSPETYEQELTQFLERFKALSAVVLQQSKKALRLGRNVEFAQLIDKVEVLFLEELMATEDANEGLQAFIEKRAPVWKNR